MTASKRPALQSHRVEAELVDVVRGFLRVHLALRELAARFRNGGLRFEDVRELVGDGEDSLLFRVKERSHGLFRAPGAVGRGGLFDLAVGALFHEAMKLRETLYQQSVYGPRVEALRAAAGPHDEALFRAFESLLEMGRSRLGESIEEVEALSGQTLVQLGALLVERRDDGHLLRFLTTHRELVEAAFEEPLEATLAHVAGSAASAWRLAGESWLGAGYFEQALASFEEAGGDADDAWLAARREYAAGMLAYLRGCHAACIEALERWLERGTPEPAHAELAAAATERVARWAEGSDPSLARAAERLTERLRSDPRSEG